MTNEQLLSSINKIKDYLLYLDKKIKLMTLIRKVTFITSLIFLIGFIVFICLFFCLNSNREIYMIFSIVFLVLLLISLQGFIISHVFKKYIYEEKIKKYTNLLNQVLNKQEFNNK